MGPDSYIKNLITTHQPQVRDNHFRWIYHHNKFSTLKKSKTPWCALQKIEHVFSRLITDFKNNYSHAEVDELMLDRLKILEDRIQQKVLDYKSKYGKAYLFFSKVFLGSIDKLSQELIDEIKKLQNRKGCEKPDKKEPLSPYSIDDLLTNEGLQNFSEENLDHTPSLDVDNTIKNTRIEEVDFTKVEFEFICSDGQSYWISEDQQKLLAEKSPYLNSLFLGNFQESNNKSCKLDIFSKNELEELIKISLGLKNVEGLQKAYDLLLKGGEIELPLPACEKEIINHLKKDFDYGNLEDFQIIKNMIQTLPLHSISDQFKEALNDYLVKVYLYYSRNADIQNEIKQICFGLIFSLNIKNLNLNHLEIIDKELLELVKCYPNLLSLSMHRGYIYDRAVVEGISKLKQLTTLDVRGCVNLTDQAVTAGISKLKQLTSLNVCYCVNLTDQAVTAGISKLKQLTSLVVSDCDKLTDQAVIEGISKLEQLTSLDVNRCSNLTDEAVIQGISKLKQLTTLDVRGCVNLTDQAVIEGISKLERLMSLNVSWCSKLTDEAVIQGISKLERLISLNVCQCENLTDRAVIEGISKLERLMSLNVCHCENLTDRAVIEGISKLEQLTSLDVKIRYGLTDQAVIEGISKLRQLARLDISDSFNLTDRAVIDGISKLEQLTSLDITECNQFTDQAVIEGISKLVQLTSLNVSNNWLTDQAVIEGISKLGKLTSLYVSGCVGLTDEAVIEGISQLKQLTSLDTSWCRLLTDRAVIEGISKLVNLKRYDFILRGCKISSEVLKAHLTE